MLPVVTLCFPALASIMRVNRAEMLETLQQDYIKTARAQGFSGLRMVTRYALRNAMIPTLAMIGLRYGWMLGGTILVETVFDWPGIGLYAVNAAVVVGLPADHGRDAARRPQLHARQPAGRPGLRLARPAHSPAERHVKSPRQA